MSKEVIITLLKRVKGWKQPKYPIVRQWLNHLWDGRQLLKVSAYPEKPRLKHYVHFITVVFKKGINIENVYDVCLQ